VEQTSREKPSEYFPAGTQDRHRGYTIFLIWTDPRIVRAEPVRLPWRETEGSRLRASFMWNIVLLNIAHLAPNIDLGIGQDDFSYSRIAWAQPVRLPWGDRRLCFHGESVSRGT
jgi:hypothetical protein